MFEFINDIGNYESRKVARTEAKDNNGIGVSTAYTSDEGYETALLDANGIHPVERYEDRNLAEEGHERWVLRAKKIRKVNKIGGFGGMIEDEIIKLERIK